MKSKILGVFNHRQSATKFAVKLVAVEVEKITFELAEPNFFSQQSINHLLKISIGIVKKLLTLYQKFTEVLIQIYPFEHCHFVLIDTCNRL